MNPFVFLKRIVKEGWKGFWREREMVFANVFILVMTISLISSLFLLKEVSQFLISGLEEKADISVYFKEETLEEDILKLKEKISQISEIKEIQYISKEKALEDFKERHKDNPVLIEALAEVGKNPFLSSLSIKAREPGQYETILEFLKNPNFEGLIKKIDYHQRKPLIEKIFSFTSNLEKGGIILSLILALVAILITFNTVKLSIINLKEEIFIQRLVGASNWFIRGPFIVQGIISGVLATLFSILILSFSIWFLSPKIEILFPGLNLFGIFTNNFWILLLIQLTIGIGLGIVSSFIAIRKYLRV